MKLLRHAPTPALRQELISTIATAHNTSIVIRLDDAILNYVVCRMYLDLELKSYNHYSSFCCSEKKCDDMCCCMQFEKIKASTIAYKIIIRKSAIWQIPFYYFLLVDYQLTFEKNKCVEILYVSCAREIVVELVD